MNSFNGRRARDGRQPITSSLCKYSSFFRSRLAAAPPFPRLLSAYWVGPRRRAAVIGRGGRPSAPAPSGCRRGGGRSMRRVTLFVNGSARNGKVRPGRGWNPRSPQGPARACPPRSPPGQPGLRAAGFPLAACGGNRDRRGFVAGGGALGALGSRVRLLLSGTAVG